MTPIAYELRKQSEVILSATPLTPTFHSLFHRRTVHPNGWMTKKGIIPEAWMQAYTGEAFLATDSGCLNITHNKANSLWSLHGAVWLTVLKYNVKLSVYYSDKNPDWIFQEWQSRIEESANNAYHIRIYIWPRPYHRLWLQPTTKNTTLCRSFLDEIVEGNSYDRDKLRLFIKLQRDFSIRLSHYRWTCVTNGVRLLL